MARYNYQNPETEEVIEVIQTMSEEHVYFDENGLKWNRLFTVPQMSFDVKCDPHSEKDFAKITNKPGTIGDLWDRSAELSEKRASKNGGIDPVKEKYFEDYSKKRSGQKHPDQIKQETNQKLKNAVLSTIS